MTEADLIPMIRQVLREELAPILMGKTVSTESAKTATAKRFSGENELSDLRLLMPYGFASRPKPGTECLVSPIAGDPTHLVIVSQYDSVRPAIAEGESCLYGPDGQVIYMKSGGEIHQGSLTATEPVVLGNVLKDLLTNILDAFLNSAQLGTSAAGPVMLDPSIRSALTSEKSVRLTTAATNILGQKNFVERGV